ncbi:hypothetical protein DITRI_Ditri20bG0040800 [Diplodiscus trichospermus]
MVRVACCDKMGMKKGPWTPEEDQILISYVQRYGHGNWRALPKLAGLPRCGKSCRLRWINYLRPDIKRGNFTTEEEETIIKLHQTLGNRSVQIVRVQAGFESYNFYSSCRWSAIAASLPGRTDNEIKNYWHGHLKKKLKQASGSTTDRKEIKEASTALLHQITDRSCSLNPSISSQHSQESTCLAAKTKCQQQLLLQKTREFDLTKPQQGFDQFPFSRVPMVETVKNNGSDNVDANRDYWYKLFMENTNDSHGNLGQFG